MSLGEQSKPPLQQLNETFELRRQHGASEPKPDAQSEDSSSAPLTAPSSILHKPSASAFQPASRLSDENSEDPSSQALEQVPQQPYLRSLAASQMSETELLSQGPLQEQYRCSGCGATWLLKDFPLRCHNCGLVIPPSHPSRRHIHFPAFELTPPEMEFPKLSPQEQPKQQQASQDSVLAAAIAREDERTNSLTHCGDNFWFKLTGDVAFLAPVPQVPSQPVPSSYEVLNATYDEIAERRRRLLQESHPFTWLRSFGNSAQWIGPTLPEPSNFVQPGEQPLGPSQPGEIRQSPRLRLASSCWHCGDFWHPRRQLLTCPSCDESVGIDLSYHPSLGHHSYEAPATSGSPEVPSYAVPISDEDSPGYYSGTSGVSSLRYSSRLSDVYPYDSFGSEYYPSFGGNDQ